MRRSGTIIVRGIVQGVGFRPFVYATAESLSIRGSVTNLGSEVLIHAEGDRFDEFLDVVTRGPRLAAIDEVIVSPLSGTIPDRFSILESKAGNLSGMIPPDVAICEACIHDINQVDGRYFNYWATSCVDCGPRYSIIRALPYDRERTTMDLFPLCPSCEEEYWNPRSRRHHAQTIACATCGPSLTLMDPDGRSMPVADPIKKAAELLDMGKILAIRGIGGFHIACIESSAERLKALLGRTGQPLAVMAEADTIERVAMLNESEREYLISPARPIVVLEKRDHTSHPTISNLHTLGMMLPYTGLHHLLFSHLTSPMLVMTSANVPGNPMITEIDLVMSRLRGVVDYFLTHDREIQNRCDDSVVRDGLIIRLSRGIAPKRTRIDLGDRAILAVGPELNANASLYNNGFCITSPHIGNIRNPSTVRYLEETVERLRGLTGTTPEIIACDLHPQFLSTRYATDLAEELGAALVPVQHHRAHIAATTRERCVGIAIDGVGYGDDGTVWGGEIFVGQSPDYLRAGHLEQVLMPGGDAATAHPERMLYGILPRPEVLDLLAGRGWNDIASSALAHQVERRFNTIPTTSTGRVLDAASALLGICSERTYDGEPAMRLEAVAASGRPAEWELLISEENGRQVLSTSHLMEEAFLRYLPLKEESHEIQRRAVADIAASFQFNLARGIARMAVSVAGEHGIGKAALSGGVCYNHMIRSTICEELRRAGIEPVINTEYPLGDGCISYGQAIIAGSR
ncbi:carbamoyltransferase HypF [Methanocalculus sp. MC3]